MASVGTDVIGVAYPGDVTGDDLVYMGWTTAIAPAVGQLGWVTEVDGHPIWTGTQNDQPTVPVYGRGSVWLAENHAATRDQHTTGSPLSILTLPVTVPAGLPADAQLRIEGRIVQGITAAGVGLILDIPLAPDGQRAQTEGGFSGGCTVVKYVPTPPAGLMTFVMTLATTVGNNTVTSRYPSMEAWII